VDLCTLDDVKLQGSIPDTRDDPWLASAITSVSAVFEAATRRWLAPRGSMTRYFDGSLVRQLGDMAGSVPRYFGPAWMPQWGRVLPVYDGITALTYLGVADADQPDDGTGSYTPITRGIHLRGDLRDGWPYTRVELDSTAPRLLPTAGYNVVKVTAPGWGPAAVAPRVGELAAIAVVRGWRARNGGDGAPDIAIPRPDGGVAILRRIAPAELDELVRDFAPDTRPALASVPAG
jgi:hypothetical protein